MRWMTTWIACCMVVCALIDATPLASGVYFAELRTPEYSSTLKLLLLR